VLTSLKVLCPVIHVSFHQAIRGLATDILEDWYEPSNNESASEDGLIIETITRLLSNPSLLPSVPLYVGEYRRLEHVRELNLERSLQEAERRESLLIAEAQERAHDERRERDNQIWDAYFARLGELQGRLQLGLPFSMDADQPAVTDSMPELPGRPDNGVGPRVASRESTSSESRVITEQPQPPIPIDPNLSSSPTASERIAPRRLIRGTTVSDPAAVVVNQVPPSSAASGSEEPRTGSSAPPTPADAATLSRGVQIATSSPSSLSNPDHEKVPYLCRCGVPTVKGGLCCEDCRWWDNEIAR
jgi:hypothetical protein